MDFRGHFQKCIQSHVQDSCLRAGGWEGFKCYELHSKSVTDPSLGFRPVILLLSLSE